MSSNNLTVDLNIGAEDLPGRTSKIECRVANSKVSLESDEALIGELKCAKKICRSEVFDHDDVIEDTPPISHYHLICPSEKLNILKRLNKKSHRMLSEKFTSEIYLAFGVTSPKKQMFAHEMAEWLCFTLKVKFEPKIGRGFALHECCDKLTKHFAVDN